MFLTTRTPKDPSDTLGRNLGMRGDEQGILTYREGMDRADVIVPLYPQIIWGSTQLNANKHSINYYDN